MESPTSADRKDGLLTAFLCGDVMTGRGIDQILPHPSDPRIHEPYVEDAREYVRMAEAANGPVPRPVPLPYIWGAALEELARVAPDARIVNLETSVTRSDDHWPGKGIHYRMHPDLILYGCGDFLEDYEGIAGYEEFRDDLTLMYFPTWQPETDRLERVRMTPMRIRNLRAHYATAAEAEWLRSTLGRISLPFGARVEHVADGTVALRPA